MSDLPSLLQALLADGPLSLGQLAARLNLDAAELILDLRPRGDVHEGEAGWHAVARLAADVVLTHLVTEDELEREVLLADVDLDLWARLAEDGLPLADGGELTSRYEHGGQVLAGPPGWLRHLAPGELAALTLRDGALALDPVDLMPEPDFPSVQLVVACAGELVARPSDEPGVLADDIVLLALERDGAALRSLLPPLSVLLEIGGLELHDGLVGMPGTDWDDDGDVGLEPAQAQALARLRAALLSVAGLPAVDGGDDVAGEIAQALRRDPEVLAALAAEVARDARLREGVAVLPGTAAVLLLRTAAADADGDVALAEQHLAAALLLEPDLYPALVQSSFYAAERSDAPTADALLARAGLPAGASWRQDLRPFLRAPVDLAGRNRPCTCGSGRKAKLCCGASARHPLPLRAAWRYARAAQFALRAPGSDVVPDLVLALAGDTGDVEDAFDEPLVPDLALFEGGLLARYLSERGHLFPEDERALVEQWSAAPLQLLEVVSTRPGVQVTLRSLPGGDPVVVRDKTMSGDVERLDVLLGRLLDDSTGPSFLGLPLAIARPWRHRVQDALDTGDPVEVARALGPQPPPRVLAPDGSEHDLPDAAVADTSPAPTPVPAELFEELGRQHEQRWLDEQVPALGGLTPRSAAASAESRPLLEALLDDLAWQERQASGPSLMQAARLRAALGL